MSHIQGTDYVGSMVVIEDGLPKKSEYRRFKIKERAGQRRLRRDGGGAHPAPHRLPGRADRPAAGASRASSPTRRSCCSSTAARASSASPCGCSRSSGLADEIPVASLAKRFEEVYVPGEADPIRIPRQSEALYLLQRIRDEAHRFAITYHRQLRGKRMTKSVLDDIPGLGHVAAQAAGQGAGRRQRREAGDARGAAGAAVAARRGGRGRLRQDPRVRPVSPVADEPKDLWEEHAGWWQDGFTEGADPEYEEQILPLVRAHLAGAQRVLDVGCGEGQVARLALADGARDRASASTRPGRRSTSRRSAAAGPPTPAAARRRCRSPTAPSTRRSPASCSSTSTTSTTPSPRWPGCCGPAAGSCSS